MTCLTEAQLENFIYDNRNEIHKLGLPKFYKNTIRQFTIPTGKIIDLFTYEVTDKVLKFRILELKNQILFSEAVGQIIGYLGTVGYLCENECFNSVEFDIVLIGNTLRTATIFLAEKVIPKLSVYLYDFDFNGISFVRQPYPNLNFTNKWSNDFCNVLMKADINTEFGCWQKELDEVKVPTEAQVVQ